MSGDDHIGELLKLAGHRHMPDRGADVARPVRRAERVDAGDRAPAPPLPRMGDRAARRSSPSHCSRSHGSGVGFRFQFQFRFARWKSARSTMSSARCS